MEKFNKKCYQLISKIPKGKISTYMCLAKVLKITAYRHIGNVSSKNPNLITIPSHRIIKSNGLVGGDVLGAEKKICC